MSDLLNKAFEKPRALTQSRYYAHNNRSQAPKYLWDLYPLAQDYFHEFNPYFVHLIQNETLFKTFDLFTVRDGMFTFADFLVKRTKDIPKWGCTFLIPDNYVKLIPENLTQYFLTYNLSQIKKPDISAAKTVLIFGLLNDSYLGTLKQVEARLQVIRNLAPDVTLEVCLPLRSDPLTPDSEERLIHLEIPELVRKYAGAHKIKWLKVNEMMTKSIFRDCFFLDLRHDQALTSDSYLNYFFLSRGGMVNSLPAWAPRETLFNLDISFQQRLSVSPFPKVTSSYIDLIFTARMSRGELWSDSNFQQTVREIVTGSVAKTRG